MAILAKKPMYKWVSRYHNTTAKSTLNFEEAEKIDQKIHYGYINSNHKDARKLKRLFNKLCPHKFKNCSCKFMMQMVKS